MNYYNKALSTLRALSKAREYIHISLRVGVGGGVHLGQSFLRVGMCSAEHLRERERERGKNVLNRKTKYSSEHQMTPPKRHKPLYLLTQSCWTEEGRHLV